VGAVHLERNLCRCGAHQRIVVRNDDLAPQGGGEPPITTVGAVIADAVRRMLRLPITPERLRRALAQGTAA
jgi:nicotinate dehydrogenase subunit B